MSTPHLESSELPTEVNKNQSPQSPVRRDVQHTTDECRKAFEALCTFMRVEFSLEWDAAGFYTQLEADRSYTWFKLGFDRAKTNQDAPRNDQS